MSKDFWLEWKRVGEEILSHGEQVQFGHSLLEIKFMEGKPRVIILSKSIKRKFPSNDIAKMSIAGELEVTEKNNYTGARTFTITYDKGHISNILLDEYSSNLL